MHDLVRSFLERAAAQPRRTLFLLGAVEVQAGQFAEHCRSCARDLAALRLPRGSVLMLSAPAGPDFLIACAAAWSEGCMVLWADERCPPAVRTRLADEHGAAGIWSFEQAWSPDGGQAARLASRRGPQACWPGRAVIKLTSGSTGSPAGVLMTGSQLAADGRALVEAMEFTAADRIVASVPLAHSYGFSVIALPALTAGSSIVVPGEREPLAAAAEHGATVLPSVPSWYRAQVERADPPTLPRGLRLLISAGEPLDPLVAVRFGERFGRRIRVLYGTSECGAISFDRSGGAAERGGVGEPVPGVEVALTEVDPATGRGLLVVRSPAVGERYVPADCPARLGGGRFVSEDLATIEQDGIHLHGRHSSWVKVKGRRVDPREVASVLEQHPDVAEAFVFGARAPAGVETLNAVVVGRTPTLRYRDLVEWCRPRLEHWKIPRRLITLPSMPRTERGKLDRPAILALASKQRSRS